MLDNFKPFLIIGSFCLVILGCNKYDIEPKGEFEVYLQVQDDEGNIKNKFAYGEDIYFTIIEYNFTASSVEFGRGSNMISVYDEFGRFVGKLIKDDILELTFYVPCIILSKEYKTLTNHWFNKLGGNKPLPKGKYKAVYEGGYFPYTLDVVDSIYRAEVNFEVN